MGFVSGSCHNCGRAGEAKLCGRVTEECLSTLGLAIEKSAALALVAPGVFAAMCMFSFSFVSLLHAYLGLLFLRVCMVP